MGLLLLVFFLSIVFAFLLIFLIQKTSPKTGAVPEQNIPGITGLTLDEFYRKTCALLEKLGLVIHENSRVTENEIDLLAENPAPLIGSPVIVHLIHQPEGGVVRAIDVMNFSSNLVGDRKGKGLLVTTGTFAPEIQMLPELPPMDFIDGKKFLELLQVYGVE